MMENLYLLFSYSQVSFKDMHGLDLGFSGDLVKNLPALQETWVLPLGSPPGFGKILEKGMAVHSSVLENSNGQRSLVGYSLPQSGVTKSHRHFLFFQACA